jgi:RimJ/RimL family protein N-acetyltransferase
MGELIKMKIVLALILSLTSFANINAGSFFPSKETVKVAEKKIALRPANAQSLKELRDRFVQESIKNRVTNFNDDPEFAKDRAAHEIKRVTSTGDFNYDIINDLGQKVGHMVLIKQYDFSMPMLFLYDLYIYDEFQKKGYGTAALAEFEKKAREMGAKRIGLHVFEANAGARKLYQREGFRVNSRNMSKNLEDKK